MNRRTGFTLIELLVVIAIIAILSAILFPVFSRAKLAAKRATDSSNMATMVQALQLYRQDQGGYPPLLLNVVEYDPSNNPVPMGQIRRGYLFRSRVKELNAFSSSLNDASRDTYVNAFWPMIDPRSTSDPNDTQYLGRTDPAVSPTDVVTYAHIGVAPPAGGSPSDPALFYAADNWDVAPMPDPNGGIYYELRYILFWTITAQTMGGGPNDNPRQLGYNDPPEDTIVTWNSFFRSFPYEVDPSDPDFPASPLPDRRNSELVLFLGGNVRPSDSRDVFKRSWRYGQ